MKQGGCFMIDFKLHEVIGDFCECGRHLERYILLDNSEHVVCDNCAPDYFEDKKETDKNKNEEVLGLLHWDGKVLNEEQLTFIKDFLETEIMKKNN